ncbi:ATP-binding protein [Marinomonas sp. CT5]|uniref:sensor histidine kinase n=1 Tax=Marinomonas sp. CT5 TaxID=2066133 RepID=UPI001BAF07A2|nr:sensor histidine kinase [Marinomonas sp. CT5]QUX97870.1 ATP-binding protein [Marinomonas sp. CT5]
MAKLKPRARLIRTIGDKLISGPEAAIIELVKNSYDADSPSVSLHFSPPRHQNPNDIESPIIQDGSITISDSGHGMTAHDIEHIWLEPATDEKAKATHSRSGRRVLTGAKGVGRFATASLGKSMELISVSQHGSTLKKCRVYIEWDIFEKAQYLEEIDIDIEDLTPEPDDNTGVTIKVLGLSNVWGQERLKSLIQELRRLATPHQDKKDEFTITLNLSEYEITDEKLEYLKALKSAKNRSEVPKKVFSPYNFDGTRLVLSNNENLDSMTKVQEDSDEVSSEDITLNPYSLGDHCHYKVEGKFNRDGEFLGHFSIVRGDNKKQTVSLDAPPMSESEHTCGELEVNLRLFDLEVDSVKDLINKMGLDYKKSFTLRSARDFISEGTGVGIYRNGFRIRPYGHHAHDWLKLEKRRVQDPSHKIGHNQLAGEIYVQDEWESMLVERSSREGLEENGAFNRLKSLITNLLLHIEAERFSFREKAGIARKPKKDFEKAYKVASLEKVTKAIESIQNLSPEDKDRIHIEVNKSSKEMEKILDGMREYTNLLESRTTLGNVVAELLHEGRSYVSSISGTRDFFKEFEPHIGEQSIMGEIARNDMPSEIQNLDDGCTGIKKLFKDLDPISGRKRGKPNLFNILSVVERVERITKTERADSEVFLKYDIDNSLSAFGHEGDLQGSLINLVLNASYWLSTVDREERYVSIVATTQKNQIYIDVINNGPLINEFHYEHLFEPGFSLKSKGHGLGLAIAREALINSGGTLSFDDKSELTTFKITLPTEEIK